MQDAGQRGVCIYYYSTATCVLDFVVKTDLKTGMEAVRLNDHCTFQVLLDKVRSHFLVSKGMGH